MARSFAQYLRYERWREAQRPTSGREYLSPQAFGQLLHPPRPASIDAPFVLVAGPPAGGKTTYVRKHASQDDLVLDLDDIAAALSGAQPSPHDWDRRWLAPALRERNRRLERASAGETTIWLIAGEPEREWREWWRRKGPRIRTVVLETSDDLCHRRIAADPTRQSRRAELSEAACFWWNRYSRSCDDEIVSVVAQ